MPRDCVVSADDLLTAPKSLMIDRITTLSPEKMRAVAEATRFALDLPPFSP